MLKSGSAASGRAAQLDQGAFLHAGGLEIRRVQPSLVSRPQGRPFAVEHREPRSVAVRAFRDDVLAKDAFEREPEALRRALRWRVQVVALPFEAAVAEIVEYVAGVQEERFGRDSRARDVRPPQDVA